MKTVAAVIMDGRRRYLMHRKVHFSCNLLRRLAEQPTRTGAPPMEKRENDGAPAPSVEAAHYPQHAVGFPHSYPYIQVSSRGECNFS